MSKVHSGHDVFLSALKGSIPIAVQADLAAIAASDDLAPAGANFPPDLDQLELPNSWTIGFVTRSDPSAVKHAPSRRAARNQRMPVRTLSPFWHSDNDNIVNNVILVLLFSHGVLSSP